MIEASHQPFGDRLAGLVEKRESQLVLGLDPDPAKLWPTQVETDDGATEAVAGATSTESREVSGSSGRSPADVAAGAVSQHCRSVIAAVGAECAGVKLQMACFERLGAPGCRALAETVQAAKQAGLIVIADGKRGDVPVTASAYAQSLFGSTPTPWGDVPGLGADVATVNPLMGGDSLEPLAQSAWQHGAGVFALVRTSNPGAADIEDLKIEQGDGDTVSDRLAALVDRVGAPMVGEAGLSSLGAVVGATEPAHITRLRAAMPHAVFLIPGVGAQGGKVEDLAAAFTAGRASALITVSRALVNAWEQTDSEPISSAQAAAAELRELIWKVSG
ncbi:MAG: orotidine-5'-phosphate decarboxylase [Solirubrobacterales bacterium]|nr:orotidine-5'-phosphate decarboxylase [Solirubrobacterales bacterium]